MRFACVILGLLATLAFGAFASSVSEELAVARQLCTAGRQQEAKPWFQKAAEKGSAEAHFQLSHSYSLPPDERILHYSAAARMGHGGALSCALDELLFRANSLRRANPRMALDLYGAAKAANPGLQLYEEEKTLRILRMCAEPKDFGIDAFCAKYGIDASKQEGDGLYKVWQLAEEASRGGRFGTPDPELVFNLVIRGGWVPFEFENAVARTYRNWKANRVEEFKIDDFVSSGGGLAFCAARDEKRAAAEREACLTRLTAKLGGDPEGRFQAALDASNAFIQAHALFSAGNGSMSGANFIWECTARRNAFLHRADQVVEGFVPKPQLPLFEADMRLNSTYQHALRELAQNDTNGYTGSNSPENLRAVQRLWIPYRDACTDFFASHNPSVDRSLWLAWLTELRTRELAEE